MIVQILSDLHFEFHLDVGKSFVKDIYYKKTEILIVAGDLANSRLVTEALYILCGKYKTALVLFVPGNHDFYESCIFDGLKRLLELEAKLKNYRCLYNKSIRVGNRKFIGTTLWFANTVHAQEHERNLNDFYYIFGANPDIYMHNIRAVKFLKKADMTDACVITHHAPTKQSTNAKYRSNPINAFFVCSLDELILAKQPTFWLHGHCHIPCDYQYFRTRIVCNPFGYKDREASKYFCNQLLIDM